MDPIYENIRAKIQKFQFYILRNLQDIDTAYFLMGNSRTGKTSLFLHFQGVALQPVEINGEIKIDVKDSRGKPNCFIGHGGVSKTKMPNIAYMKDINSYLIDCPGLLDSEGFQDDFTNQYFIMRVFRLVKQARFLLCVSESDLRNDNKSNINHVISGFLKYFNQAQVNYKEVIKNTSVIITKKKLHGGVFSNLINKQIKQKEIIKKVALNVAKFFHERNKMRQHDLIQNVFGSDRFYFFTQPSQLREVIRQDRIMLEQKKRNQFYKMNYKTDINYKFDANQASQKYLIPNTEKMYTQIITKICQVCKIITMTIKEMSQNASKLPKEKTYAFREAISHHIRNYDIYVSKIDFFQRKQFLKIADITIPEWMSDFTDIKFIKAVKKHFQRFRQEQLQQLCQVIFVEMFKYCYLNCDNTQLYNLVYITRNYFQELKIIKRVIQNQKFHTFQEPYSLLQLPFDLQSKEIDFVLNFECNQSYKNQDGLSVIKFFEKGIESRKSLKNLYQHQRHLNKVFSYSKSQSLGMLKNLNLNQNAQEDEQIKDQKDNIQIRSAMQQQIRYSEQIKGVNINFQLDFKTVARLKQMELKIISIITKIYQITEKYDKAYRYLSISRTSEIEYQDLVKDYQNFTPDQKLYRWLARICQQKFQNYYLAIQYCRVIRFEHRIRKLYRKIRPNAKTASQRMSVLKSQARFLAQICDPGQAKLCLEEAFEYARSDVDKVEILNMVHQIVKNAEEVKINYLKKIQQHKFYKVPNNREIKRLQVEYELI